jgi:hypothetical protein
LISQPKADSRALNLKENFVPFAVDHNSYGKGFLVLVEDGWDFLIEGGISNIMSNNKFKKLSVAMHR